MWQAVETRGNGTGACGSAAGRDENIKADIYTSDVQLSDGDSSTQNQTDRLTSA